MTTPTDLQSNFEYELKRKLSEKARNPILEMKTLINCFKYYDTNNEGQIDKSLWVKGILRTGVTNFSEDDLDKLFNSYVQSYSGKIDYKDFCNYIYGRERTDALSKSLKNTNLSENVLTGGTNRNNNTSKKYQKIDLNQYTNKNFNYKNKQNRGYGNMNNINNTNIYGNSNDKSNGNEIQLSYESEVLINKIKRLIHIDNGVVFYSFVKYLKTNEDPISYKISIEDLSVAIQELHLNISYDEIHEFFNNLDVEKTGRIPTNDIINVIKGTLNDKRKSYINTIFSTFVTDKKGKISVNDFKILFNARNHPDVLEGKKTEQEIYNQFCYTIDVYIRINNILSNSLNNEQFIDYYSGISPSIKTDEDFKNILVKVWNVEKPKNIINKYSLLSDSDDNAFGDDNIGINSIFLGVSKSQRPKYDYNYDYLEEFSKSSPNLLDNKKNKNKYGNGNNNNTINSNNKNSNETYNGQIMNYSYKKNNQTKNRNNSRNTALSTIGEKIMNDYDNINANINQTMSYSNNIPIKNTNSIKKSPEKYFNYESRKTPQYKGKKIFKAQRYNPITDEYIQENINENNMTKSAKVLVVQDNIQTPNNNLYIRNNYNQSNNQNNYIKEEIGILPDKKENGTNNKNEEVIKKESENQNQSQNYNLKENSSLIKFRNILKSQGTKSIFRFQRMLSIYDKRHSGLISFDNFYNIFKTYYANISLTDIKSIFSLFDTTSNPNDSTEIKIISDLKIKYDELLKSIIGNMPLSRQIIVKKVFDSFEKGSDGKIMTNEIKTKFNYSKHPDALSGKNSAIEIYNDFLDFIETFREYNDNLKGRYSFEMSYDEFADFYSEISMYIEDDDYFEKLLKNCWSLEEENTDGNKNMNTTSNNKNLSNSYQRSNQYNNQNIRMKTGSQIINNNIF